MPKPCILESQNDSFPKYGELKRDPLILRTPERKAVEAPQKKKHSSDLLGCLLRNLSHHNVDTGFRGLGFRSFAVQGLGLILLDMIFSLWTHGGLRSKSDVREMTGC